LTPKAETQLSTQDKAYTVVFSPQTANETAKTQLGIQMPYSDAPLVGVATIRITRIVLDESAFK
jgi:hypothetical protein